MRTLVAASCGVVLIAPVALATEEANDPQLAGQRALAQLTSAPSSRDPARQLPAQRAPQQAPAQPAVQQNQTQTAIAPVAVSQNWTAVFSTESRYFSWRNNFALPDGKPGHGWEFYQPFAIELSGKPSDTFNVDVTVRGGWVKAVQSTTGLSGSVQSFTDTVASGTLTYLGWEGVQPFVSLNANLPTGQATLLGSAANARMDPDFVDIATFGEGFNLGPTAGINFPITSSLLLTTSVGYTWRGRFNQDAAALATNPLDPASFVNSVATSNVDPGDDLTVTGAVNYQTGPFSVNLTGTATWETPTTVNGTQTLKAGDRYLLALQSVYTWPQTLGATTFSASVAHSNRNSVFIPGAGALVVEALNSNSNVYRLGLQHLVPFGDLQIGPIGSFLYRDHNGYNSATLQFVPQKTRWSAGILAQYAASATVTLNGRVEGVWTRENENPAPADSKLDTLQDFVLPASAVPRISGAGWQTSIGINFKL